MAKIKRSREEAETYDSDGGFVSNDDGNAPKSKKSKKTSASKGGSEGAVGEDSFWALSSGRNPRRVGISDFKGSKLVSIREYYEKDDELLPGKKGISLNIDQYKALLEAIPEINASLKGQGIDVGRSAAAEENEDEPKLKKKVKGKKEKSNIEETSDEEDE